MTIKMQIANVIKKNEREEGLGLERNDFLNLSLYYDSVQKLKSSPNLIREREGTKKKKNSTLFFAMNNNNNNNNNKKKKSCIRIFSLDSHN
jgi:hypothetical protein